jgi:mycothiol synthase
MSLEITPSDDSGRAAILALARDPALESEYDAFAEPDFLDRKLGDPYCDRAATLIAREDGEPVGFSIVYVLPRSEGGAWAAVRIGVAGRRQRQGIGTALYTAARRALEDRAIPGGLREIIIATWRPNPAAEAFAARHGFQHVRCFWRMDRATATCPEPVWPAGVTLRTFDGSEAALVDWNGAYNSSFAQHYHFVPSSLDHARHISSTPQFLRDGLGLAYRGGRCVGFCRNEYVGKEGEIGVLGVVPEARGIGLGRALLRWGTRFFGARGEANVTLRVDGENESALALYRGEGFEVTRTRDMWSLVPPSAAADALSARETRSAAGTTR